MRTSRGSTVAIVGAGPAGVSLAKILSAVPGVRATVFEAREQVGGKSLSAVHEGAVHDMGTCYATLAHRITNRWMRDLGIKQLRLGAQFMDDRPFIAYAADGSYAKLGWEAARYLLAWRRFDAAVRGRVDDEAVKQACARPIEAWLDDHRLPRIHRMMLRGITAMGYGFLGETPTCQALRWCDPALTISGATRRITFPIGGWQGFWARLSADLDIRLCQKVERIERQGGAVTVHTADGQHLFDQVVVTIPLDELASIMDLTAEERFVADAIEWGDYTSTLVDAEGWFTECDSKNFAGALESPGDRGALVGVRVSGPPPSRPDGARSYICYQYSGSIPDDRLKARLVAEIQHRGAKRVSIVEQRRWKYFPRYHPDAIKDGLLGRMEAIQGHHNTWFSGASFSFESVANVVSLNRRLSTGILARHR